MTTNSTSDSNEAKQAKGKEDSFVDRDILDAECKDQQLADLGYYKLTLRDPENQQSEIMEILLSGDPNQVKAEYAKRELRTLSQKSDGSNLYEDIEAHLMTQVLHSHTRLAEARRQIHFLEDFIKNNGSKQSSDHGAKDLGKEMIKASDEMLVKAKEWKIKSTYKPRFDSLTQHIERTKANLQELLDKLPDSKKRSLTEAKDTETSNAPQQEMAKRPKRQ